MNHSERETDRNEQSTLSLNQNDNYHRRPRLASALGAGFYIQDIVKHNTSTAFQVSIQERTLETKQKQKQRSIAQMESIPLQFQLYIITTFPFLSFPSFSFNLG